MPDENQYTQEKVDDIRQEGYDEGYEAGYEASSEAGDDMHEEWKNQAQDVFDEAISVVETAFEDISRLKLPD